MEIFAITTRGLEDISTAEIGALAGVHVEQTAYRRVDARVDGALAPLLDLRTVDDVFLRLAGWTDVGHQRTFLATFSALGAQLAFEDALAALRQVRSLPASPAFSVTANFVGKRNYSAAEIKTAVAGGISSQYPRWSYVDDDRDADLNVRVFIEHDRAWVGLRIDAVPLYRRGYKAAHVPGALKPPVAAAMLRLARARAGDTLLDPFCGSGTILVEASLGGVRALGGDVEEEALRSARANAQQADVSPAMLCWDARRMPLRDASADVVVSNLPWGRQIEVDTSLKILYAAAFAEMRRITAPEGQIVLLTAFPELLGQKPDAEREISLFGQTPTIVTFTVE